MKISKKNYDNEYPSVTQVLGVLRKIELELWFKYNDAKFCDEKSKKGKEIGTLIHKAIEDYINTGEAKVDTTYTEEVTNALNSFMLFRKEHPEFKLNSAELKMTSELYKCNGTLDCQAKENGNPVILDWKTGECKKEDKPKIYSEFKYQISAYVNILNEIIETKMFRNSFTNKIDKTNHILNIKKFMEELTVDIDKMLKDPKEQNLLIQKAYILVLAKDKVSYNLCKLEKKELDDCFNEVFFPCLKIWNYQKGAKFQVKLNNSHRLILE